MRLRIGLSILALSCAALAATVSAAAEPAAPVVLTGVQATYSLTTALTAGTPIQVRNVPADGRPLAMQKDYIGRRMDSLAKQFAGATAVVTLTNALPDDPLYRFARDANIRIVNIDAAIPWSLDRPGVALIDAPRTTVAWAHDADPAQTTTAPYFWLSLSNVIRMADLIAADLTALFPDSADPIRRNLDRLKRSLLRTKSEYQDRLIEANGDVVFALTPDFAYLTNDMGLLVDGYFIKQDVRWTAVDLDALTKQLKADHVRVVLHKWQPSDAIQKAIAAGGAKLVVLDAGDPGLAAGDQLDPEGLQKILTRNLDAITQALGATASP